MIQSVRVVALSVLRAFGVEVGDIKSVCRHKGETVMAGSDLKCVPCGRVLF